MKHFKLDILLILVLLIGLTASLSFTSNQESTRYLVYTVNPKTQTLKFYWKSDQGEIYKNFKALKTDLSKNKKALIFAMNGGMYTKSNAPLGLYVENGKTISKLNTVKNAYGNFYMQPNGVFCLTTSNSPIICTTPEYSKLKNIKYATQSGPMLVINGKIHPKFTKGSKHINIRNGVGILPNGHLLFAMSKEKVNLYDFALFFKSKGCKNALYLDGFVSRTYLPSQKHNDLKGNFGVIIAETKSI